MLIAITLVAISGVFSETTTAQAKTQKVCPETRQAISFYRSATWKWQKMKGTPITKPSARSLANVSCPFGQWVAKTWQKRSHVARVKYEAWRKEKARQWNWQAFPQWVQDLARCESSYNWWAEGSSSDGVFYSAFNISRSQYDIDAHHMGVRGWHEGRGVPSPYEQAMAVIGHMRLLGDGFTGRCHGIARSSW
jgi:hypothetical protein